MMRKPIEQIVETLAGRVRTDPSGAKSLAHVQVVVPTAQSGRRLRLALAARFGALVPPRVKTPYAVMLDDDDPTLAGRTDELVAFRAALGCGVEGESAATRLDRARQLSDLRAMLAPRALSFADVADAIASDLPEESARWRELAAVEAKYLDALAARGRTDRIVAMKAYAANRAAREAEAGIEETLRFDDPAVFEAAAGAGPSAGQVVPCATMVDEAERAAAVFAAVGPDEAPPALCVADPALFPETVAAFEARGMSVHDPSRTCLATSSLGHLVAQLTELSRTRSYSVFSAFIRGGDVRRWLCRELRLSEDDLCAVFEDLDNRQAEFLPETVDDIAPKTHGKLRAVFEFVQVQLRKRSVRAVLGSIFGDRTLRVANAEDREFAAAAEVVCGLLAECGDDRDLLTLRLEESTYSLEPDEGDSILSDGWMELPFLEADELVVIGFREGCVPESTVGHPFLPDSLRRRLGLPDNAAKEARDRAILRAVVASRAPGAVRFSFHAIDAKGESLKPSRLLFETSDDADLVARVRAFYGVRAGTVEGAAWDLPREWKLRLPVPPASRPLLKTSPTRLDGYLRCPFTYYLRDKEVLGDKRLDDRAQELAAWEYGNLAHGALEAFAAAPEADSTDAGAIRAFLEARVDEQLAERFGTAIPAIVALQGESVKRRLAHFAEIQSARRAEGWRIVAAERKLSLTYGHTLFSGKCDRVDFNADTGEWCVIDYKTWDSAVKAAAYEDKRDGERVWRSVQLPLYCAMLDAEREGEFASAGLERISACYCVLGKTKDDVVFTERLRGTLVPEAEKVVEALVTRIEAGIFWPPAKDAEWSYDFKDWLAPSPEATVDEDWIADQLERIGRCEHERT